MNYWARYGMEFNQFIHNAKKQTVIETAQYKEVQYRLNYLKEMKGFGVLTGGAGTGKTTSIRNWQMTLDPSQYKVIYISLTTVTTIEFYREMSLQLGMESRFKKIENYHQIQEAVNRLVLEKNITSVVLLDEADHLSSSILCDIKVLFSFEMESKDRAIVVMTDLPIFNNTLRLNANEPLRQRIIMNYNMAPLSEEDGLQYIHGKLDSCSCHQPVFLPEAERAILNASGNALREVNKICDRCLLLGDARKAETINAELAMDAINDAALS